jgi:pimeloyl-ACP methyl ester carboxylesterase
VPVPPTTIEAACRLFQAGSKRSSEANVDGVLVMVNGVRTYYEAWGDPGGEPLVLLHGGLAPASTWKAEAGPLSEHYRVYVPERRGHGHTRDLEGPITFANMAADTIAFLHEVVGGPANLVGWSDGGITSLTVALTEPDLVRSLVAIGTTFHHDGELVPTSEWGMEPDGPEMAWLRGLYADASPDGADHWPVVFAKVMRLWAEEPTFTVEDLARIQVPVLVMVGDDDGIRFDHTVAFYEALAHGQLAVVPAASHALPLEKPDDVTRLILAFLRDGEPTTFMPARRAASQAADQADQAGQGVSR